MAEDDPPTPKQSLVDDGDSASLPAKGDLEKDTQENSVISKCSDTEGREELLKDAFDDKRSCSAQGLRKEAIYLLDVAKEQDPASPRVCRSDVKCPLLLYTHESAVLTFTSLSGDQ